MAIPITSSLLPTVSNTPLDPRTVVDNLGSIPSITRPFVGMLVYVKNIDKYVRIKSLDEDEELVRSYDFLNSPSFVIDVVKSGNNYVSDMSSQGIYDEYTANGSIPVVKQDETIYSLTMLTRNLCRFVSVQGNSVKTLTVQGENWQFSQFEHQSPLYYCTITKSGNTYTSSRNYHELLNMFDQDINVMLVYNGEIYSQIYDDGESTMMFASLGVNGTNVNLLKVFKIENSTVTYLEKDLSQIAGYNKLGLVQTVLNNPNTKYMLPIAIDSEGKAFNGLEIIEVEEPGLYVVDENMDAGFSSQVGTYTSGSGGGSPAIPENLETRISTNETNITDLQTALNGIRITIIEEED